MSLSPGGDAASLEAFLRAVYNPENAVAHSTCDSSRRQETASRMPQWIQAIAVEDCPAGEGREILVGDRIVAIYNVQGEFHALDGLCAHQGGPLGKGKLCGAIVTCPWHGWQYDVRSGQHQTSQSVRQPALPVRIEGGWVWVDVESGGNG